MKLPKQRFRFWVYVSILWAMYFAMDIGGTKTLLAVFNQDGKLTKQVKFPTPPDYIDFIRLVKKTIPELGQTSFKAGCVAAPGKIDRKHGVVLAMGNLDWGLAPIAKDIRAIIDCPVVVENDTKLAALSEAIEFKNVFNKVLYVTVSTGISSGLVTDQKIVPAMADSESGHMLLEHNGKLQTWESFASGKAIVKKFGKLASEIDDPKIWSEIARNIAIGLIDLIATMQPELIVIGGGVGTHFAKFKSPLQIELKKFEMPLVPIPPVKQAKRPEEAVIYGCYYLAKSHYA